MLGGDAARVVFSREWYVTSVIYDACCKANACLTERWDASVEMHLSDLDRFLFQWIYIYVVYGAGTIDLTREARTRECDKKLQNQIIICALIMPLIYFHMWWI